MLWSMGHARQPSAWSPPRLVQAQKRSGCGPGGRYSDSKSVHCCYCGRILLCLQDSCNPWSFCKVRIGGQRWQADLASVLHPLPCGHCHSLLSSLNLTPSRASLHRGQPGSPVRDTPSLNSLLIVPPVPPLSLTVYLSQWHPARCH